MSKCTTCHVNGEYVHDHPLYPVSKCSCACHKDPAQLSSLDNSNKDSNENT